MFYFTSTLHLLNLYLSSIAVYLLYKLSYFWQWRSKGPTYYSHTGNVAFPSWERIIPTLGIFGRLSLKISIDGRVKVEY